MIYVHFRNNLLQYSHSGKKNTQSHNHSLWMSAKSKSQQALKLAIHVAQNRIQAKQRGKVYMQRVHVEKLICISVDVAWTTSETQSVINGLMTNNQWWSISSRLWPTTPPFPPCFSSLISHLPPFPPPCLSLPLKPHWGLQSYLFAGLNLESPSLGPRLVLKVVLKRERASERAGAKDFLNLSL